MQAESVINPQENSRNIDKSILMAENLFIIVAVLVTSAGFFVWGSSAAAQYTDEKWLQIGVGIFAAVASAYVTDFAFRKFLEEVVYQGLAAFHPNVVRKGRGLYFKILDICRWLLLTIVVGALFYADWNSVQTIRDPFAAQARQRETTDVVAASAALNAELKSAVAPMSGQIASLKSDISAAERRTERANGSLVALATQGNGWAARELEKKKQAATKAQRKELNSLQSAYTKTLSAQSETIGEATRQITARNADTDTENRQKRESLSNMFFMFGAGSKALTVILRIFLVVSFLAKTPTLDANGDGVVDGRDVSAAARGDESFR